MKRTRLFYVRCNGDGSWLTQRRNAGGGHIFEHAPADPMLVSGPMGEWRGAYELIPSPFTVETWPHAPGINAELQAALDEAKSALVGDSNDAEHHALVSFVQAMGLEIPDCTCDEGPSARGHHDKTCPSAAWEGGK